jgi:ribonucleoside-diphosphate reductase alpha chain
MQKNLPTQYQQFIHLSRYSRWMPEENRRETWEETVSRYFTFFESYLQKMHKYKLTDKLQNQLKDYILDLKIMPSMRCLMTAGEALEKENIAGYNCSYVAVDKPQAFDEILYILMNGTGVGFSVDRQSVNNLPDVAEEFHPSDTKIVVADSKLGWAKAFKELLAMLYHGQVPKWDLSKVRPAGAPLKTFGGRASGPEPLDDLFKFSIKVMRSAAGRKLTSLECHDIICKIAEVVVVGGVRRSALISLSNLSDDRMRDAKTGRWWETEPQRALANNSAIYTEVPDMGIFLKEWKSLYDSKSGERGIFNRAAAVRVASENGRRKTDGIEFGTNPCSEIILRSREFCNLSEVVVRAEDTMETLKEKVKLATILGTFQSTLVNFKYIAKEWNRNCEEERLLGVSLTGIMECRFTNGKESGLEERLQELKQIAVDTNKKYAKDIGINQSVATTCVKPSGTVSQLVDSASGIHTRHNPFYIRTVRGDVKDPLTQLMIDVGFPYEEDYMNKHSIVFSFPQKADKDSVFRTDMSAIEQLAIWKTYQEHWCEHKPSVTISVKEDEWMAVGAWVYENFDYMSGVSFLPYSDHIYKQAPYQDCTEKEYNEFVKKMPKDVDWGLLSKYELSDQTIASQELACSGPEGCDVTFTTPTGIAGIS